MDGSHEPILSTEDICTDQLRKMKKSKAKGLY
jgi:hypothetical protein